MRYSVRNNALASLNRLPATDSVFCSTAYTPRLATAATVLFTTSLSGPGTTFVT